MSDWTATPHVLEVEHFLHLAAGTGDQAAVTALWRTERSWRMSVLRKFLDTFAARDDTTGPLLPVDDAWQLIIDADRVAHHVVEEVLARPTIGLWAVSTLRRVDEQQPAEAPLWSDIGYLHSIAAACAIRAGLSFELEIPVRHGTIALPTVGAASLPHQTQTAWVRVTADVVTVTADDVTVTAGTDTRWHPPIIVEVTTDGVRLEVELLDRDLYRDARGPAAPLPLTAEQADQWRDRLGAAWAILVREQPDRALSIAATLRALTPLPAQEQHRQLSASGAEAFGAVLLSEPDDPAQLAMTLVHETQHNKLGALLHAITMLSGDRSLRYYAPWRDDPRPLGGLLQGSYAFSGIVDFWRAHRRLAQHGDASLAHFEFALWRHQAGHALRALEGSGMLTGRGTDFVACMHDQIAAAQDEPVPDKELTAALRMAGDHFAMWLAHNVRLDPATEDTLVTAWDNGDALPTSVFAGDGPPLAVIARPEIARFDTRAVLTRHRLAAPDIPPPRVEGAIEPDYALVSEDLQAARTGYLEAVTRAPGRAHHWIGYALATGSPVLLKRPEIVLTVARRAKHLPDPARLVTWVSDGLPERLLHRPEPLSWRVV